MLYKSVLVNDDGKPAPKGTGSRSFGYGLWRRSFNALGLLALLIALTILLYAKPVPADEPITVLALGDSLTAGYGLAENDAFTTQLQAELNKKLLPAGYRVSVINGGVSGDTTAGGLARIAWLLGDDPDQQPDFVLVSLGANDGLRGLDPQATEKNLKEIVTIIQAKEIPVMIAGMLAPPNLGPDYGRDFNGLFPRVATETGVSLYPFFLDGVVADPALNQEDGIHPNGAGVKVIVRRLAGPMVDWIADHLGVDLGTPQAK